MRKSGKLKKVLTFVCLFTFVLLSVPFAVLPAQAARAQNINIGECYQVDSRTPIVVDGLMDEAYTAGFVTYINYPATQNSARPYTFGVAYFVWSERSLYCYVIVNDDDIVARRADYWQADCVELYVHRGDDVSRDYPETENEIAIESDALFRMNLYDAVIGKE